YGWRRLPATGFRRWCMTCGRGGRRAIYGWRRRSWTGRRHLPLKMRPRAGLGKQLRSIYVNIYAHRYNALHLRGEKCRSLTSFGMTSWKERFLDDYIECGG